MLTIPVGSKVIAKRSHWKRAGEIGEIVEIENISGKGLHYLIKFDHNYPGGGIGGDMLWLYESDFDPITKAELEHYGNTKIRSE